MTIRYANQINDTFETQVVANKFVGGDIGAQINAACAFLTNGGTVVVLDGYYIQTTPVVIENNITVKLGIGSIVNSFPNGTIPWKMKDNTALVGSGWGSKLMSPVVFTTSVIVSDYISSTDNALQGNKNIVIKDIQFIPNPSSSPSVQSASVQFGNVINAVVDHCYFNGVEGYAVFQASSSVDGYHGDGFIVQNCTCENVTTQQIGVINCANWQIKGNTFRPTNATANYTVIDCESNTAADVLRNFQITDNIFDFKTSAVFNPGSMIQIIGGGGAPPPYESAYGGRATYGVIANNVCISGDFSTNESFFAQGLNLVNCDNVTIANNEVFGASIPISLSTCNSCMVVNNTTGYGKNNEGWHIYLANCFDCIVKDNKCVEHFGAGWSTPNLAEAGTSDYNIFQDNHVAFYPYIDTVTTGGRYAKITLIGAHSRVFGNIMGPVPTPVDAPLITSTAELKNLDIPGARQDGYAPAVAILGGYTAQADGGWSVWKYDRTSTATDNGITVIKPNNNAAQWDGYGRWLRATDQVHISTTARDALLLSTSDMGFAIWNTTTQQNEYWDGGGWVGVASNSISNVAALRTISPGVDGKVYNVTGYYTSGDGGGGEFYWDASSTLADDAGTIINPNGHSGAGRWIRVYKGSARSVLWFGARGDVASTTGSITAGTNSLTVSDASKFAIGQGIAVLFAGPRTDSVSAWQANHVYTVGTFIRSTTRNDVFWECVIAGTSASSEPAWKYRDGYVINDGTAQWRARQSTCLTAKVSAINGNVLTLDRNAISTVTSQLVYSDDYLAFRATLDCFGSESYSAFAGGKIVIPSTANGYFISQTLHIYRTIRVEGDSIGSSFGGVRIFVAPGVSGIQVDAYSEAPGGGRSDGSTFRGLYLFPVISSNWTANTAYPAGYIIQPTTARPDNPTIHTAIGNTKMGYYYRADNTGTSGSTEPSMPGSIVSWPKTLGATFVDGSITWTCIEAHGLIAYAPFFLTEFHVEQFNCGVYIFGGISGLGQSPEVDHTQTPISNTSNWHVSQGFITSTSRHGLFVDGTDANIGTCARVSIDSCTYWGVLDWSDLGNDYIGCHTDSNGGSLIGDAGGPYGLWSNISGDSAGNLFGCYSEPGQGNGAVVRGSGAIFGGTIHGSLTNPPVIYKDTIYPRVVVNNNLKAQTLSVTICKDNATPLEVARGATTETLDMSEHYQGQPVSRNTWAIWRSTDTAPAIEIPMDKSYNREVGVVYPSGIQIGAPNGGSALRLSVDSSKTTDGSTWQIGYRFEDLTGLTPQGVMATRTGVVAPTWQASHSYSVGDKIVPTDTTGNGSGTVFYFTCLTAGVTGANEPTWSIGLGATTADGGVTWGCGDGLTIPAWSSHHAYSTGDKVHPTVFSGAVWECILAGTSGITEPSWSGIEALDGNGDPAWQANHAYLVGDIIRPSIFSGYIFKVTIAGTSGTTQPTWPTDDLQGGVLIVDNGVTWTTLVAPIWQSRAMQVQSARLEPWHSIRGKSGIQSINTASLLTPSTVNVDVCGGNVTEITLANNVTSWSLKNPPFAHPFHVVFIQDATGSRTLAGAAANIKFTGGTPPTLSTSPAARDVFVFSYNGTEIVQIA